nr:Rap1a/Tai family immunity protein [Sphingobium sp. TCM1]
MMRALPIALAAAALAATPAPAARPSAPASGSGAFMFETGATLLSKCRNKAPEYGLACTAYIVGVVDGIRKDAFIGRGRPVCWPDRMGADEARRIVVAYLERWPDQRKAPASVLVSVALNERYPCQK